MIDFFVHALRADPEIAVFLAIGLGVLVGRIQIGSFHLGSVAGALLMGLIIGQIGLEVPHELKSVFFVLFIYAVGFKSGPEFFGCLNRGSLKLVLFSVVLCATALGAILLMNAIYHFDAGFTAGLGAGALTDTAIMGTASSAIAQLGLDDAAKNQLYSHMAVAYAITYVFGTVGLVVFVGTIAPKLLGVDLRASARELELELGIASQEEMTSIPYTRIVVRAHLLSDSAAQGMTISALEHLHPSITIERVVRDATVHERDPGMLLKQGDIVGVYALREDVGQLGQWLGAEIDHPEALSFPTRSADIVLTNTAFAGKTVHDIRAALVGSSRLGCFIDSITRQGLALPLLPNTVLHKGDVIAITGRTSSVMMLAAQLGRVRERSYKSDIAVHSLGMVLGALLGMVSAHIGMIPIELGVGGGVLLVQLPSPGVRRLAASGPVGVFRVRPDRVWCGCRLAGRASGDCRDAERGGGLADIGGGGDLAAAVGVAVFRPLCVAVASDGAVRCPGRCADRGSVDEQDHRAVREQHTGDWFYGLLCHFQCVTGRLRANHRVHRQLTCTVGDKVYFFFACLPRLRQKHALGCTAQPATVRTKKSPAKGKLNRPWSREWGVRRQASVCWCEFGSGHGLVYC